VQLVQTLMYVIPQTTKYVPTEFVHGPLTVKVAPATMCVRATTATMVLAKSRRGKVFFPTLQLFGESFPVELFSLVLSSLV
jgi:hypothetical protein